METNEDTPEGEDTLTTLLKLVKRIAFKFMQPPIAIVKDHVWYMRNLQKYLGRDAESII